MVKKEYYKILGVSPKASMREIKTAYRQLALKYHPDRVSDPHKKEAEEKFKEIAEAYYVLSNLKRRQDYRSYINRTSGDPAGAGDFAKTYNYDFEDIMRYAKEHINPFPSLANNKAKVIAFIIYLIDVQLLRLVHPYYIRRETVKLILLFALLLIFFSKFWENFSYNRGYSPAIAFEFLGWLFLVICFLVCSFFSLQKLFLHFF